MVAERISYPYAKTMSFSWTKVCHVPFVSGINIGSNKNAVIDAVTASKKMGFLFLLPWGSNDVVAEGRPTESFHPVKHTKFISGDVTSTSFFVHLQRNHTVFMLPALVTSNERILQVALNGAAAGGGNISLTNSPLELRVDFTCLDGDGGSPVVTINLPIQAQGEGVSELTFSFVKRCWPPVMVDQVFEVRCGGCQGAGCCTPGGLSRRAVVPPPKEPERGGRGGYQVAIRPLRLLRLLRLLPRLRIASFNCEDSRDPGVAFL